jgi:predicted kinase
MPTLYLMVGLPASGKTTYAKKELSDAIRVCYDDLVEMLTGEWDVKHTGLYHALEQAIIQTALFRGYDVVVDRTNVTRKVRQRFAAIAYNADAEMEAVIVTVSLKTALERNKNRERVVPEEAIKKLHQEWEEPTEDEGFSKFRHIIG